MRSLTALLLLGLLCYVQQTSSGPAAIDAANRICCSELFNKMIPVKKIVSYYNTSSTCAIPAVVFRTITGKEICVDPKNTWVKKHITKVNSHTVGQLSEHVGPVIGKLQVQAPIPAGNAVEGVNKQHSLHLHTKEPLSKTSKPRCPLTRVCVFTNHLGWLNAKVTFRVWATVHGKNMFFLNKTTTAVPTATASV